MTYTVLATDNICHTLCPLVMYYIYSSSLRTFQVTDHFRSIHCLIHSMGLSLHTIQKAIVIELFDKETSCFYRYFMITRC